MTRKGSVPSLDKEQDFVSKYIWKQPINCIFFSQCYVHSLKSSFPIQVVNDREGEYHEDEGRVFVYNSDYDECPTDTRDNWWVSSMDTRGEGMFMYNIDYD